MCGVAINFFRWDEANLSDKGSRIRIIDNLQLAVGRFINIKEGVVK